MSKTAVASGAKKENVSLDEVYSEVKYWRENKVKNNQSNMPDSLWDKILQLVEQLDTQKVKNLFGVSSEQIKNKQAQRQRALNANLLEEVTLGPEPASLSEPSTHTVTALPERAPDKPTQADKFYRPSHLPDKPTCVVEIYNAEGKLMKIHMTTDTIREVFDAFYRDEMPCSN